VECPRTLKRLEYELVEDEFTRGAQIAVERAGERVIDIAVGDAGTGAPLTASTVFRVYCTIKPFTAVAVARLVDMGLLDLDEPLEDRLPDVLGLTGGVTTRHLLTHTAGLDRVRGIDLELIPAGRRRARIAQAARRPGWRLGREAAYSEAAAWHVLGWVIEQVTGDDLRAHLRCHVIEPIDLRSTWIGMTHDEYGAVFSRLGVNFDTRQGSFSPMLYERSERVCCETNPAFGGYTTAADLARFYTALLERLAGAGTDALPSPRLLAAFCSSARPDMYDQVLDRSCPFGLGFMTSLDRHAFGDDCNASSFGHSGYVGTSFAFADPEHALAVGVIFNGIVTHESAFLRRRAIVRSLYADIVSPGLGEPVSEPRRKRWFNRRAE
jgi:CubicO group peptidase (beta-lactamase class C family)